MGLKYTDVLQCFLNILLVAVGPPNDVRATVTTPRSVKVTWDRSPSDDATGYLISYITMASYIDVSNRSRSSMVTGRNTRRFTLTNLEENTPYTITIQTDSNGQLSVPSEAVPVTTWTAGK